MRPDLSPSEVNFSTDLPTSPAALMERLAALDIPFTLYEHKAVFTVEESQEIDGLIPGCHTRNLFIRDKKGTMFLVTLRHDTRVDLNKLSTLLGCGRVSFGSPDRLWTYLGVRPGSVTPFAIVNDVGRDVTLVLEEGMMQEDIVNYHPLVNTMTIGLTPDKLLEFFSKINVVPRIIDLSAAAPDKDGL